MMIHKPDLWTIQLSRSSKGRGRGGGGGNGGSLQPKPLPHPPWVYLITLPSITSPSVVRPRVNLLVKCRLISNPLNISLGFELKLSAVKQYFPFMVRFFSLYFKKDLIFLLMLAFKPWKLKRVKSL